MRRSIWESEGVEPWFALRQEAQQRGFLAEWAPLGLPEEAQRRYRAWLEAGNHASMDYLLPSTRLEPAQRFAWARSVLVLAAPQAYPDPGPPEGGVRLGRVARYAWVRDYHVLLEPYLRELEDCAAKLGVQAKGYVDTGPFSERSYAVLSGLGWVGRNAMLMRMGEGAYLSLALLLTSLEPPEPAPSYPNRCGRCTRCLTACPTGALLGDGTLDARRCISYWTIEHRGLIPAPLWPLIGDWLFGCDLCQEVCPWNRKPQVFWSGFRPEPELAHPDLEEFFSLSSRAFARRYERTVFLRPGRNRMARNALIVLANRQEHLPLVRRAAGDVNPVVRATAARALARFGDWDAVARLGHDPQPEVAQEAQAVLAGR
ncbi:MAG: tRNA epoxyqueuosine(34) reductase QueG [Thermaceae bacterium]|nr:tRNA epoxyqueuosine(34) reductase QueG [Thermaceae bacterium]